jgi:AcrR family transcriptional regulator
MAARKDSAQRDASPRLDASAWIAAALDALADGGIEAVRVEPLAKALGVTKGSFYWHFADRRALLDAVLDAWMEGRIGAIRQQAAERDAPAAVLRRLAGLYTRHANVRGLGIELAIRSFAPADARAAKAVRSVDAERLQEVAALFAALGWPHGDAQARAVLFYSYLFGQSLLDAKAVTPAVRAHAIAALITPPA